MTKLAKYFSAAVNAAVAAIFVFMLIKPADIGIYVSASVAFCLKAIIPSLFVYMVLAEYLFPRMINLLGGRHAAASALIGGVLCGFPVGARMAVKLRENGCDKKYADYINSFSNNASASFVLSFAGGAMLGSEKAGVVLLLSELASAFVCAVIMRFIIYGRSKPDGGEVKMAEQPMSKCIFSAAKAMMSVCACIIVFMCVSGVLLSVLPQSGYFPCLIKGFLEFSGGIEAASAFESGQAYVLAALFIGWSGVSVFMQVSSASAGKADMRYYFLSKIIQAALMALIALLTKDVVF